MLIGILADAHGNAAAVRHALEQLSGRVDQLIFAGDAIYEYRFSNELLELIREHRMHYVLGNHEMSLLGPNGARARAAPHVDLEHLEFLRSVPERIALDVDGRRLLVVHGSPWKPYDDYVYAASPILRRFSKLPYDYVVLGHTHVAMASRQGSVLVINPGSVGESRDGTPNGRLSYAILDTATDEVSFEYFADPTNPVAIYFPLKNPDR